MRISLLEAISPTARQLLATQLFCVGYAWQDKVFGELTSSTVTDACDAESALRSFKSQHRHIDRCWIIEEDTQP